MRSHGGTSDERYTSLARVFRRCLRRIQLPSNEEKCSTFSGQMGRENRPRYEFCWTSENAHSQGAYPRYDAIPQTSGDITPEEAAAYHVMTLLSKSRGK